MYRASRIGSRDGLKFWRALSRGGEVPTILGGKAVLWQRLPEIFEYELHREQSQVPPTKKKLRGLLSSDFHFGVLVVTSQNCCGGKRSETELAVEQF